MLGFGKILAGAGNMMSNCLNFVKAFDVSSFISNGVAVKVIVPSLIGGVIVGSAAMSFKNSIVEAILGGDYNLSGKGLSDEENAYYDELYKKLSEKSIDLSRPEQYDFILPHKIIAGVDRVLYGLEGSDSDREMIVGSVPGQGLRPEFRYVEKEETYQEIIKVTSIDGLTSETVTPEQKTKVQLLEEIITYNRHLLLEYEEATHEYEDKTKRITDPATGTITEVWVKKKNFVVKDIKGDSDGEKNYLKLETFIEINDPDYSMVEEHINMIKELDELLEDLLYKEEMDHGIFEISDFDNTLVYGSGSMVWPVGGGFARISSPFGWRIHPITGERQFHTGIDIPAPTGTDIYAAADGKVVFSGEKGINGLLIVIDHGIPVGGNGHVTTVYCHCSRLIARAGDYVKAAQVIGKVGSTGRSTGPHLHFGVKINNEPVNPLEGYLAPQ